ncbi:MAG: YdhR family protein [Gammaproteobacteria bacterium]
MVVVRVLFPLNTTDIEGLKKKMLDTAPKYEGLDGLTRKYYVLTEDHKHGGGIYLWESREKAEAWYNADWMKYMTEVWGQAPLLEYLECPIVVDNETNNTTSQVAA